MKPKVYHQYTTCVPVEPEFYGPDCSPALAREIADRLTRMIKQEFPGIQVWAFRDGTNPGRTFGPNPDITALIDQWIEQNWTAAI